MQPEELGIENADNVIAAIDLKSFYASVECHDRGLDPLKTNLVVADISRTEKTIGLAVSPSLKAYGIPGRPRLFEVIQKVEQVNAARRQKAPKKELIGESYFPEELQKDPTLAVGFIIAQPRMRRYMEVSAEIYNIYLRYQSLHLPMCRIYIQGAGMAVTMIEVYMPPIRQAAVSGSVTCTVTLPAWIIASATERNIDLSQVLREALNKLLQA